MSPNEIVNRHVDLNIVAGNNIPIYNQYCNLPTMHCKLVCYSVVVYLCICAPSVSMLGWTAISPVSPGELTSSHHQYSTNTSGWADNEPGSGTQPQPSPAWFCLGLTLSHLGSG